MNNKNKTIWYINKYQECESKYSPGGRGFLIMKELSKLGYDTVVFTSDSTNLTYTPKLQEGCQIIKQDHLTVVWLKTMKYKVAKSIRRVLSWFDFELNLLFFDEKSVKSPDVVIVSCLSLFTVINGLRLKNKYNCKLIMEVRDIWPLTLVAEGGFSKYNPLVAFMSVIEKLGYKYSDDIVGTMPNLGLHVSNVLGYEKKVHCVPMGVMNHEFYEDSDVLLPEGYISQHFNLTKFNIVYAGTIGITNALEVLFKSASLISNPNVHITIVGDGALKQQFIEKYGLLKNVSFAPKVSKNQVQSVLKYADVVYLSAHPSILWEFGQSLNKVIDYMRSGKPIIASYTGHKNMLEDSGCAFFAPANEINALATLIDEVADIPAAQLNSIGIKGKDWLFRNQQYDVLATKYESIIGD
ncbi:MAG: glycosyltransferase family 4 protein [Parashewanella sp.]